MVKLVDFTFFITLFYMKIFKVFFLCPPTSPPSLFVFLFYPHVLCPPFVSTLLVRMYIALFLLPYGAKGANMHSELRYNNCAIIITTITVTFSVGFQ